MIQKTRPPENFTPISNEVFRDERLNLTDRGLLMTLMSLPANWDFSVEGMSKILPDGKSRIKSSVRRLEEFGYIEIIQERNDAGKFAKNRLVVKNSANLPSTESPSADNRSTDERSAENHTQYNSNTNTRSNNTQGKKEVGTLPNNDYEDLVKVYGKAEVDDQIRKILSRNYTGCMNKETIGAWCLERQGRKKKQRRNPFNNFDQRKYSADFFDDIEQKMMGLHLGDRTK